MSASRKDEDEAALDAFFAAADDVIADWEGTIDAGTWAADGSHQPDTIAGGYYGQDQPGASLQAITLEQISTLLGRGPRAERMLVCPCELCALCRAHLGIDVLTAWRHEAIGAADLARLISVVDRMGTGFTTSFAQERDMAVKAATLRMMISDAPRLPQQVEPILLDRRTRLVAQHVAALKTVVELPAIERRYLDCMEAGGHGWVEAANQRWLVLDQTWPGRPVPDHRLAPPPLVISRGLIGSLHDTLAHRGDREAARHVASVLGTWLEDETRLNLLRMDIARPGNELYDEDDDRGSTLLALHREHISVTPMYQTWWNAARDARTGLLITGPEHTDEQRWAQHVALVVAAPVPGPDEALDAWIRRQTPRPQ